MKLKFFVAALAMSVSGVVASAQLITSYDITNATPSGYGSWQHTYSGTISGSAPATYTGGSGTLNDGTYAGGYLNSQLFDVSPAPVITLHLDDFYLVQTIAIYGGDFGNFIPGTIDSMSVSFGGSAYQFAGEPFGYVSASGPASDLFTISGPLANIATDRIILSNFGPGWDGYFSIAEIEVSGTSSPTSPTAVPEPSTYGLFGAVALAGLVLVRRFRRQRSA